MFSSPPLPSDSVYTQFWCEENVYLLAKRFTQDLKTVSDIWETFVVFISNESKKVALWNQKISRGLDEPVVWDYHVILVLRPKGTHPNDENSTSTMSWVYDFDTRLGLPVPWTSYFQGTFSSQLPSLYQSVFRIIPGAQFIADFASDRSHMLIKPQLDNQDPMYHSPPPLYPCIRGSIAVSGGIVHNLMNYISMDRIDGSGFGEVYTLDSADRFFNGGETIGLSVNGETEGDGYSVNESFLV